MIGELLNAVGRDGRPTANVDLDLSPDATLEALSNSRRRELIRRLAAAEERDGEAVLQLGAAADYVAATEQGVSPDNLDTDKRKSVYVGLYQRHLPTLEKLDIVTVDENNAIRPTADVGTLAELLTAVEDACIDNNKRDPL